jgi:hypothetical protein
LAELRHLSDLGVLADNRSVGTSHADLSDVGVDPRGGTQLRDRPALVAGAAQEEGEDSVHPPAVEEPKCLRFVAARNEQRLISGIIIDTHDYYIVNASNL